MSTLRVYFNYVWGKIIYVFLTSVVACLITFAVVDKWQPVYEVHFSYLVSLSTREQANEYTFDGYYALQATSLYTETLSAWVKTPEVVMAAYQKAGLDVRPEETSKLIHNVNAAKSGPQLVGVTVKGKNQAEAMALATALQAVMVENMNRYHDEGVPALQFRAVITKPWVGITKVAIGVIETAVFLLTFFLTINALLLWKSLDS